MDSIKNHTIVEYGFDRLEDILVPYSVIERQVSAVEGIDLFKFKIVEQGKPVSTDKFYGAPYPFIKSVREEYNYFDNNDLIEHIEQRVRHYYKHAVPIDVVKRIDSDPNVKVILNITDGNIGAFTLDGLKGIRPIVIPRDLPMMLMELMALTETPENIESYSNMYKGIKFSDDEEFRESVITSMRYARYISLQKHLDNDEYMILFQLVRNGIDPYLYDGNNTDNVFYAAHEWYSLRERDAAFLLSANTLKVLAKNKVALII